MIVIVHLASIFSTKIRRAVTERYNIVKQVRQWTAIAGRRKKTVLIHASSMGEFEHIKPLIIRLHEQFRLNIVVTFFSPSAYEFIREFPGVDLFIYHPFDTVRNWKKIYGLLNPVMVVISKHDVWPNQVWIAEDKNIPVFLINASLSQHSGRTNWAGRLLLGRVYTGLREIFTISTEDLLRFQKYFSGLNLKEVGDTKFDQVMIRRERALEKTTVRESWTKKYRLIVLGSIWPEDAEHLLPALSNILREMKQLGLIVVPHQPHDRFLDQIQGSFTGFDSLLYTERDKLDDQRILLVNSVGVLADLYRYAEVAYVGGSFRQGIHNVMEPAIYGIPVICGPVYRNSFEAIRLHEYGGSFIVRDTHEFEGVLRRLLTDEKARHETGRNAGEYAVRNTGATERIIREWQPLLSSGQSMRPG